MAEPSVLPPSQFKQSSRKGKKAWRKNVDLTELHEGLEEARTQLIDGGITKELPSEELFVTDTAGSQNVQSKYNKKHRPLKAHEILAQRSAIPGVQGVKRSTSASDAARAAKRNRQNNLTKKEYDRLRNVAYGGQSVHKDVVKQSDDASYDPWADEVVVPKTKQNDFLDEVLPVKEPATIKAKPLSMAASGRRVRSVRVPASEKSYNPTAVDWQARFDREGAKEVAAEQSRLDAVAEEEAKIAMIEAAEAEEEEAERESEWESEWEGFASGTEEVVPEWLLKKRPERKSKVQRNKIKKRKAEEGLKKHEAHEKVKRTQSERIRALAKEVSERERQRLEKNQQVEAVDESSDDGEDVELKSIKPFGKAPIPEAPLEIMLLEDLPDSLRRLKPEGNLLTDRYRSLLLQGKIESRRVAPSKKKQPKLTEKWSYKDWKLK